MRLNSAITYHVGKGMYPRSHVESENVQASILVGTVMLAAERCH